MSNEYEPHTYLLKWTKSKNVRKIYHLNGCQVLKLISDECDTNRVFFWKIEKKSALHKYIN